MSYLACHTSCRYIPLLWETFTFPQSLGILGGRPGSSTYIVGIQDNKALYLDPHEVQPVYKLPLRKFSIWSCIRSSIYHLLSYWNFKYALNRLLISRGMIWKLIVLHITAGMMFQLRQGFRWLTLIYIWYLTPLKWLTFMFQHCASCATWHDRPIVGHWVLLQR